MLRVFFICTVLMMNYFDSCENYGTNSSGSSYNNHNNGGSSPGPSPTFYGTIFDETTGDLLEFATVCINNERERKCKTTDDDGRFTIYYNFSDRYTIVVNCEGYVTDTSKVTLPRAGSTGRNIGLMPN